MSPLPLDLTAPLAMRREDVVVLAATLGLAALALLVLLGVSVPKLALWVILAGGAALAFIRPEIGLFALILNALIGLTHLANLPRIGPLSVPIAFEAVLVAAILFRAVFLRQRLFIASPQHLLILALAAWMIVSLLAAGGVEPRNLEAIRNLFLVRMLIFFLLTNILMTGDALKRFVVVVMAANAGLVAVSFLVRSGYFGIGMLSVSDKMLRTRGLIHNPNTLAFDLITMLIFCAAAFYYVRGPIFKTVLAVLAACDVLTILTTLSRSGFVSLCVVLLYVFLRQIRSLKAGLALAALAVLVVVLMPAELTSRFSQIEEIQDIDRVKFFQVAANAALQNPVFGVGFGNYFPNFHRFNNTDLQKSYHTYNLYMNLWAEMGLPALILYVAAVVILWRRLWAMRVHLKSHGMRGSFLYVFGVAVEIFFVNLAVFGLSGDVQFEYSVFIVMGFGILLYREHMRRLEGAGRMPASV